MLKLTPSDITLHQSAHDKVTAIKHIALSLCEKGLVDSAYADGMLNREAQSSTYLGNGIAIPHGTTDTRSLVKTTGVAIHHYPEGVKWDDGNTVFVAIGIAAKSDEHLSILKQLTKVLGADGVESKLRQASSKEQIIALLQGDVQFEADLDGSLIQVQFPASDMLQMSAVAAGLLKNAGNAERDFVADLVAKTPTHLGKGLWLVGSQKAVTRTAVSYVSTANNCEFEGQAVKGLVAFAATNDTHFPILAKLSQLVFEGKQALLLQADTGEVLDLLKGDAVTKEHENGTQATFRIKNAHGLHARPGAMLVAEAKKFESNIRVSNLDGDGKAVNAKSLMKVIALGVKHGHQLQFSAEGPDAASALESIGKAIASGLGEG